MKFSLTDSITIIFKVSKLNGRAKSHDHKIFPVSISFIGLISQVPKVDLMLLRDQSLSHQNINTYW
ncbi:hypothetical protein HYW75_06710 [Candidatus Pacearchaeota archaeon]|nr:hypothetical protein [Candidatus Pacearchaeota archaeon]